VSAATSRRIVAWLSVAAMSILACGDDAETNAAATPDGTEFTIAVGDDFQIVLESTPASGERWVVSEEPPIDLVEFAGESLQAADPDLADAPSRQVITFRGVADAATIRLWSVGASGIPVEPVERAEFPVLAGDGGDASASEPISG